MLLAITAVLAQTGQPEAAPPVAGDVTVIERPADAQQANVPIRSRIARRSDDSFVADPVAAMYLREWASCIVRMHRRDAVALLASPFSSPEQARIIDQLTGRRFTRRTLCARFRFMRVDNLVLRGAIAEALYRWEQRMRRSAGPLDAPSADVAGPTGQLVRMGRCVVEREGQAVANLIDTRPDARRSAELLAGLEEEIDACLSGGLRADNFHPLTLRGALGEPLYISRRAAAAASVNPEGGAQPRS